MKPDLFLLYFAALLLSTVPARFQPSKPAIPHPFSLILFFQQLHEQPQPDSHFPVLTLYIPAIPPLSLFTVSLIYTAPIPSSVFQPRCSHSVIGFPASLLTFRHRFSSLAARISSSVLQSRCPHSVITRRRRGFTAIRRICKASK